LKFSLLIREIQVVAQNSDVLAPLAVEAVLNIVENQSEFVDLKRIKIVSKLGGSVDDCKLVNGLIFSQTISRKAAGPVFMKQAKIGVAQFYLGAPNTEVICGCISIAINSSNRILT
jgi:T-complex protein 1 subunit delta